jgi:glycerol transport system substrate-binding protein
MKLGYQDCGAWTLPAATPLQRRRAAWLYAQFCAYKSVSLKKTPVGLTPIRRSDIHSAAMTEAAPQLGGLVAFYRSLARMARTPTGLNVPDYPKLAQLWWSRIGRAVSGALTPQQALDELARAQDQTLARITASGTLARCAPALVEPEDPAVCLARSGAPKPKREEDDVPGRTIDYETLVRAWHDADQDNRPRNG